MHRLTKPNVCYHDRPVGTMARYQNRLAAFEYDYARCAVACGLEMEHTQLFPSSQTTGYFGTRRFDRNGIGENDKIHECEKLFRLMCFNVFAHNRDDHSKNFSYLYHEKEKSWRLSPAYDLTYSNSIGAEHATTINNNGSTPSMDDLLAVAKKIGLHPARSKKIASDIRNCVHDMLGDYLM